MHLAFRELTHPIKLEYCDKRSNLRCGNTEPEDPLCIYKDKKGIQYLTGTDVTAYFCVIYKLVMRNISDAKLKLILTHSIRVYACVLLSEPGKDRSYIKLLPRWLSNYFEMYLRNTDTFAVQHGDALDDAHSHMIALAISSKKITDVVHISGNIDLAMNELEDEDLKNLFNLLSKLCTICMCCVYVYRMTIRRYI